MGYWPSNVLIVFIALLFLLSWWQRVFHAELIVAFTFVLAYHHWQAHLVESDGSWPAADRWRLGAAVCWTLTFLVSVFLWI